MLVKQIDDALGVGIPSPISLPGRGRRRQRRENVPAPGLPPKYPEFLRPIPVNTRDVNQVLISYLNQETPELQRFLFSTWTAQADAIKFQELRNAVRDGDLTQDMIERWRQDYSRVINERFDPAWRSGVSSGAAELSPGLARLVEQSPVFNAQAERIEAFIDQSAARLTVALSDEQERAARNVIRSMVVDRGSGVDELDRVLRPVIGLTDQQAQAVVRFRDQLVEDGRLTQRQIDNQVGNFSGRLQRLRSRRVAQTEIAYAHNFGQLENVRQHVDDGAIQDPVVKRFSTALDERVCPFCGPLEGVTIDLNETWPGATSAVPNTLTTPIHPFCRCVIVYQVLREQ